MMPSKKMLLFALLSLLGNISLVQADQLESYQEVLQYPYHAAPYYAYPSTNGYGYQYSAPIVNSEYTYPYNNKQIVVYPDGPYHYEDYYKYGATMCYLKAHTLYCEH